MLIEDTLSLARIVLSLAFLVYASWSDLKAREVENYVWVAFAPIAAVLTITQFVVYPPLINVIQSLLYYAISFAVTSTFSIVLFYAGAFGGADAKALMCIALAIPLPPHLVEPLSGFVSPIFPITVFSNGVILAAFSVFYSLLRNLWWTYRRESRLFECYENGSLGRKLLVVLSGYKVTFAKLKASFLYPLEDLTFEEDGSVKKWLLIFPRDESREEILDRMNRAESEGKLHSMIWATPGLPMLVFITAGFILAWTVGDIIWILISQVLG